MASFRVLIIGGGIAGPAAAHWLSRLPGAHVTILERSPAMRATGQQIDLRVQGIDVMNKMGIEPALRAVRVLEPGIRLVDTRGKERAFFPVADPGSKSQNVCSEYEIMRSDFVRVLYALTQDKPNVRHIFGQTVTDFTQDDESNPHGKVHVTFSDGRQEDFDLVVGADGTGSKTRRIMLGPDAPDPRRRKQSGYIGFYSIPSQPGDSDCCTACLIPGPFQRAIMTRHDRKDLLRVYAMPGADNPALDAANKSEDLAAMKRAIADDYKDCDAWETKRFMEALLTAPEADDLYVTAFDEVNMPKGSWSKGRVVLVGDAAHSGGGNGYGTSWGLIGAYMVAGELATRLARDPSLSTSTIAEAMKTYEELFRPQAMDGHEATSSWFSNFISPRSEFTIDVVLRIAAVAAYFRLDHWIGIDGKKGKWNLPEYPALMELMDRST